MCYGLGGLGGLDAASPAVKFCHIEQDNTYQRDVTVVGLPKVDRTLRISPRRSLLLQPRRRRSLRKFPLVRTSLVQFIFFFAPAQWE